MRHLSQSLIAAAFLFIGALSLTSQPVSAAPGMQICDGSAPPNCAPVDPTNGLKVKSSGTSQLPAALGQGTGAQSLPVVLSSDPDYRPVAGNITTQDIGSATATGQNSSSIITGTATPDSFKSWTLNGMSSVGALVSNTWTGTLEFDLSYDGGVTWVPVTMRVRGSSYNGSSSTANGNFSGDVSAATNFRIRSTAAMTGTATVQAAFSATSGPVQILNPVAVKGLDGQTTASASNPFPVVPDGVLDGVTKTASVTSATSVISFSAAELQGMNYIMFGFTSAGSGNTVNVQAAADGSTFNVTVPFWRTDTSQTATTTATGPATNQQYIVPITAQAMKINVSVYGSGTVTAYATPKRGAIPLSSLQISALVSGNAASAAADSGNPVKVGGKYNATQPTLTDGNRGDLQIDGAGNLRSIFADGIIGTSNSITSATSLSFTGPAPFDTTSVVKTTGFSVAVFSWVNPGNANTLIAEGSMDQSTWSTINMFPGAEAGSSTPSSTTQSAGLWAIPVKTPYIRLRVSNYVSGTVTAIMSLKNTGIFLNPQVVGTVASGSSDAGNPIKIGGKYTSSTSAVSSGQRVDLWSDQFGNIGFATNCGGCVSETASSGNQANATATATLAAASGKTTYITGFQITSDGATVGGCVSPTVTGVITATMTYTYCVPTGVTSFGTPLIVALPVPVPASATNTTIAVVLPALGAGSTNATVTAQGFQQ